MVNSVFVLSLSESRKEKVVEKNRENSKELRITYDSFEQRNLLENCGRAVSVDLLDETI